MAFNKIIIHCSFTPASMDIGAGEIRRWHVEDNGWSDIGYHYVICRDGTVEEGRPLGIPGAHCKGHNDSYGICLVGGKRGDEPFFNFTGSQIAGLGELLVDLCERFDIPMSNIHGHNEFSNKECPCFSVKELMS